MNSRETFAKSMERLLLTRSIDDIRVSEIVAGTPLSRKTFYHHFKDKFDLANWYLSQIFDASVGRMADELTLDEALMEFLSICQSKCDVLKNAYASRDVNNLRDHDVALTKKAFEKYLAAKGADIYSESMRFSIDIAARGGTDMVIEWLVGGMKMEKARLVCLIKQTLPNDILQHTQSGDMPGGG
jgi:AcrR family transcriptional regulator